MTRRSAVFTVGEAAEKLDVGRQTILMMIADGRLKATASVEGRWKYLIPKAEIEAFLRTHVRIGPGPRGGYKWLRRRD